MVRKHNVLVDPTLSLCNLQLAVFAIKLEIELTSSLSLSLGNPMKEYGASLLLHPAFCLSSISDRFMKLQFTFLGKFANLFSCTGLTRRARSKEKICDITSC